jgi:O-antigen/teichoic acid export membrane protein
MDKDDSSHRLISNSFYLMADWFALTILSLVFWLVVGKTLPTSGYGIVATSLNISLLIAAFGLLGLPSAATNLISRFVKQKQIDKAKGIIKFSTKFALVISISSAVFMIALSNQIAVWLNLPVNAIWLSAVLIFGWAFWLLTNGFLQGMQNMRLIFRSNFLGAILRVAIPVTFFFISVTYVGHITAYLMSFIVTIALRYKTFAFIGGEKVEGRKILLGVAFPVFIASVMWLIFTNLPNVILNAVTSPDVTGLFAITLTLVAPITFIPMTLSQALFPITSGLSVTKNPRKRQSKLISLVVKFAAFITLPTIALLLVFSNQIILFFSQPQYLPAAQVLPVVAVSALFLGIGQILVSSVFAIGRIKMTRNITVAVALLFISSSAAMSYLFGLNGMAFSYLASMILLVLWSYVYLKQKITLSVDWRAIGKIFVGVAAFVAITYPTNMLIGITAVKIVSILVGALAYLAALAVIGYYTKDELKIAKYMSSRFRFLKPILEPAERYISKKV